MNTYCLHSIWQDDAGIVDTEIVENSIDQNTIPHFSFGSLITSTTASSLHSTTSLTSTLTPKTTGTTKRPLASQKPAVLSTTNHQKITTSNRLPSLITSPSMPLSSLKPETSTVKLVPITTVLNTESKTEASNEQEIIEKLPETTIRNSILTKIPITTEESIKLQTFQSVQGKNYLLRMPSLAVYSWILVYFRYFTFPHFVLQWRL